MSKVQVKRKSTRQDLAPMSDVGFLLLTFFILTASFTKQEAILVTTPSSISEIKIPETNIVTVIVDSAGKVFFGMDGQPKRVALLEKMAERNKMEFTPKEIKDFSCVQSFGVPIEKLKLYLKKDGAERAKMVEGIPVDSANNQFKEWIFFARMVNPEMVIAIKADKNTPYKVVKNVISTLQDIKENRFNLITNLESAPKF